MVQKPRRSSLVEQKHQCPVVIKVAANTQHKSGYLLPVCPITRSCWGLPYIAFVSKDGGPLPKYFHRTYVYRKTVVLSNSLIWAKSVTPDIVMGMAMLYTLLVSNSSRLFIPMHTVLRDLPKYSYLVLSSCFRESPTRPLHRLHFPPN